MSGLQGRRWYFFIWDDGNIGHLLEHGIRPEEAEQVFFNRYVITPNKKKHGLGRYRIDGRTDGGRYIRLIFEGFGGNIARVITGWDI